jgi:hypothetical protein
MLYIIDLPAKKQKIKLEEFLRFESQLLYKVRQNECHFEVHAITTS